MTRFYDEKEQWPPATRRDHTEKRIQDMLNLAYQKSSRIKQTLDELHVHPAEIRTLDDFEKLPVITRAELIELEMHEPPYAGLDNPDIQIGRIFTSPGPVYEPHLSDDDPLWARAYVAAGIQRGDVVLNAFSYHMVAAGLTFHGGINRAGATVVPSGTSSSQVQVQLIKDLNVTAFTGTPSFFLSIIRKAEELGYNFKRDFRVKRACFAAEPLEPSLRRIFENEYDIDTYQMYGATEVGDIAFECNQKHGWHICDEVYVEILDPLTRAKVPPGTYGEVVATRYNDTFFLFRFATGDLSRIIEAPCACGRTSYRMDGIVGRVGDAVKVRGLFITPNQVKKVLDAFKDIKIQAVISRRDHEDRLTLNVESKELLSDSSRLETKIKEYFKEVCTVKVDGITFLQSGTLPEDANLIVDQREWK